MQCLANLHGPVRRHYHPDLLTDGLPGQHNMGSKWLGHPHRKREAFGLLRGSADSRFATAAPADPARKTM